MRDTRTEENFLASFQKLMGRGISQEVVEEIKREFQRCAQTLGREYAKEVLKDAIGRFPSTNLQLLEVFWP